MRYFVAHALTLAVTLCCATAVPQTILKAGVNEVHVQVHALTTDYQPVMDLKAENLSLHDNGKLQTISTLIPRTDLPLRLGFLFDISPSMGGGYPDGILHSALPQFVQLLEPRDKAYVQWFDFEDGPTMEFSADKDVVWKEMRTVGHNAGTRIGGTALHDSLYRACRYHFEPLNDGATSNAIFVLTDGEDNASHAYLSEVISECQLAKTAVYIYSVSPPWEKEPQGLRRVAEQSGGEYFHLVIPDVQKLMLRIRNFYDLVYSPNHFKADGKYHKIELDPVQRRVMLLARSGYYAPSAK